MRILHTIGRTASVPGSDLEGEIVATALWQRGQDAHVVIAAPRQAPILAAAQAAELGTAPVEASFIGRAEAVLRAAVRRHGIEVIHAHDDAAGRLALTCVDMCPVVRTLDADEAARFAEASENPLPFDHVIVAASAVRDRLVKAALIEREHVTIANGRGDARLERMLDAYERAIVRSLTGRLIPARFVGGPPSLRRLAALAAE
jgi:hypothetical protein